MSLTFELDKIDGYEQVCWIDEGDRKVMNPVTNMLIMATMFVGWEEITEANHVEWYTRLRSYEIVAGSLLQHIGEDNERVDRFMTLEDVRQHIGLRTNAFPKMTDAKFAKRLYDSLKERVDRELRSLASA